MLDIRRSAFVSATTIAGVLALGACGSWYQRPPETAATPCTGRAYLEVRNSFETPLEIYGYVSGTPQFLGTVSPGVQRLPLANPVGFVYAQVGGQRVTGSTRNGNPTRMSVTRGCEAATN